MGEDSGGFGLQEGHAAGLEAPHNPGRTVRKQMTVPQELDVCDVKKAEKQPAKEKNQPAEPKSRQQQMF